MADHDSRSHNAVQDTVKSITQEMLDHIRRVPAHQHHSVRRYLEQILGLQHLEKALKRLGELIDQSDHLPTAYNASRDVLDRVGGKATERVEVAGDEERPLRITLVDVGPGGERVERVIERAPKPLEPNSKDWPAKGY